MSLTPDHKFKLLTLLFTFLFILAVFYVTASFTQNHIDAGEVVLSLVVAVSSLLPILGIDLAKPKDK